MRLLCDQDVYHLTINLLRDWGHDVITAKELNMSRATDEQLLTKVVEMNRIFVTRDKDFGALVFLKKIHTGVILLRIDPLTINEGHKELECLLRENDENELLKQFSIVEPTRYRIRKINN